MMLAGSRGFHMKRVKFTFAILLMLCMCVTISSQGRGRQRRPAELSKMGEHKGERKQLDVNIAFSGEYGQTVTDASGTYYHVWGWVFYENKVYPPEYWGVYPLYFFGTPAITTITVHNKGPRRIAKLRARTECYCLRTDGSNGAPLTDQREVDFDVLRGETQTIDATFIAEDSPEAESGLDRFIVKLLHPNSGGGPGNPDPALIMLEEGILCPPEYEGEIEDTLGDILNP